LVACLPFDAFTHPCHIFRYIRESTTRNGRCHRQRSNLKPAASAGYLYAGQESSALRVGNSVAAQCKIAEALPPKYGGIFHGSEPTVKRMLVEVIMGDPNRETIRDTQTRPHFPGAGVVIGNGQITT
jgi:hypothetical protein